MGALPEHQIPHHAVSKRLAQRADHEEGISETSAMPQTLGTPVGVPPLRRGNLSLTDDEAGQQKEWFAVALTWVTGGAFLGTLIDWIWLYSLMRALEPSLTFVAFVDGITRLGAVSRGGDQQIFQAVVGTAVAAAWVVYVNRSRRIQVTTANRVLAADLPFVTGDALGDGAAEPEPALPSDVLGGFALMVQRAIEELGHAEIAAGRAFLLREWRRHRFNTERAKEVMAMAVDNAFWASNRDGPQRRLLHREYKTTELGPAFGARLAAEFIEATGAYDQRPARTGLLAFIFGR